MASTGPVPLTTARGPLLIRARLSMHDDTDSDISPVYTDISGDESYESASDPGGETMTMGSGTTGLESSSDCFGRSFSMPKAKISGDEEYESLEEDEVESDWRFGGAKVLSNEKELNLIENVSEDGSVDATDIPGKEAFLDGDDSSHHLKEALTSDGIIEGNSDREVGSGTKTDLQDANLKSEVVAENIGVQSNSLDGYNYGKNGEILVYGAENTNKKLVTINHSEDKESPLEPEFETVESRSPLPVPSLEDANSEEVGENLLFRVEDAHHKPVEGDEGGDTRNYKLPTDRGKGTITADASYFDEAADNESSVTTLNFDEENLNECEEGETVEFDPAALAAFIRRTTGAPADATVAITSAPDGTKLFSVNQALPADTNPVSPSTHTVNFEGNLADASLSASCDNFVNLLTEDGKKVYEKVSSIRVKFIRLVNQLGLSVEENRTASEVLNRLNVAESLKLKTWVDDTETLEKAKREALCLDAAGNDLNFSCTILVLGKTGVGKSALINSIFKNEMSHATAFNTGTDRIREIVGVIDGVVLRVIDTPGLSTSVMDQGANQKLLSSIRRHVKKCHPDVVLYVDRVDLQTRNFNDIPILTSITETMGSALWQNVVRVLTHAGSDPPEGPSGAQLKYETYISQQVIATQRAIHMATKDMTLSNPVALVDNHATCRTNQRGEQVLPNGIAWRPNLLLLCYSVKILSEVHSVLEPDDFSISDADFDLGMVRLPLQFFLSSLLRSRPHLKQTGGTVELDNNTDELSDSDLERGEDEYDTLPPFKPLKSSEIKKLSREQKKIYLEEYAYRIKLFENKQRKEAVRKSNEMMRNMSDAAVVGVGVFSEEQGAKKSVHINDLVLPLSFDGDCPSYRYRSLETSNSWVQVRAVSDAQGWDHDCGLNGVILDYSPVIGGCFPSSTWVQLKKNKEEFMIHLDSSICASHGKARSTLTSLEIQKFRNCTAYILHGETRLKNLLRNSTTGGISVAFSGDTVATGWKIANHAHLSKQVRLTGTAGMMHAKDGAVYGCDLEARIRSRDYPVQQCQSSVELNLVKVKEFLSIGASFKTQLELSSGSKLSVNLGVDGKKSGHLSFNVKSSDQTEIVILGLISLGVVIFNWFRKESRNASAGSKILQ